MIKKRFLQKKDDKVKWLPCG